MANYDYGGGCSCGLNKECECSMATDINYGSKSVSGPIVPKKPDPEDWGSVIPKDTTPFKFSEGKILKELDEYVRSTYGEHYKTDQLEAFDVWIALGDSMPTFRNTAIKYLWRYGKKGGKNKKDLFKAMHYIMLCLHVDHFSDKDETS